MPIIDEKTGEVSYYAWEIPRDCEYIGIDRTTYPGPTPGSTPQEIADRAKKLNNLRYNR